MMCLRLASLPFLLSIFLFPPQADLFRKHYEAANAYHRAGNYAAAEAEFKVILSEAYERLGKVYSAQNNYQASVSAFESARAMRPDATDGLVELAIAYFHAGQYAKGIEPLQRVICSRCEKRDCASHARQDLLHDGRV